MADRFPSIEDMDAGKSLNFHQHVSMLSVADTFTSGGDGSSNLINNSANTDDFLARERALLGNDADQFSTPQFNTAGASVEDDDDDLLGGGGGQYTSGSGGGADMGDFESSFPSIDTSNEVS